MDRVFQTFIDSLHGSVDSSTLGSTMTGIAEALELGAFAYLFAGPKSHSEVKLISNYPSAWTSHYLANGYQDIDPVIDRAARTRKAFQWGCKCWSYQISDPQIHLLEEAAYFGIRCGFTIPIHDPLSRISAVTFASAESSSKFNRCVERHESLLLLLAILFHSKARLSLAPDRSVAGIMLSPREFACLEWALRGKSAWEIGRILNISRRTAAFHLDNAKSKLGVRTISQAVALLAGSTQCRL